MYLERESELEKIIVDIEHAVFIFKRVTRNDGVELENINKLQLKLLRICGRMNQFNYSEK